MVVVSVVVSDSVFELCCGHGAYDGATFDCQVTKVCSWVYATLHRLRLLKFLTTKLVRLKLCKALHISLNCNVVFSYLSSVDSRRLQVAFNTV
jgi:hypothetical protein